MVMGMICKELVYDQADSYPFIARKVQLGNVESWNAILMGLKKLSHNSQGLSISWSSS